MNTMDKKLLTFLETFPYPLHHKKPEMARGNWVFWREDEEDYESSLADVATNRMIHEKIKSFFSDMRWFYDSTMLQLWVPVTIDGRRLLSTSGQPFSVDHLNISLANYRLRSLKYLYNIDETNNNLDIPAATIISGPTSDAFINRLVQTVNLEEQGSILERYAFDSGLLSSYLLPICCPSLCTSSCVGVLEFSSSYSHFDGISFLNDMKDELQKSGLSGFNVQERIPYKNINSLKPLRDENEETQIEKISQGQKVSIIPEASEGGRKLAVVENYQPHSKGKCKTTPIPLSRQAIEQQFGNTLKEAAKNLNVSLSTLKRKSHGYGISEWQGPSLVKRKVNDLSDNQRYKNEEDYGVIQNPSAVNQNEDTLLIIKAEYAGDMIKFYLSITEATFVAVEKEIGVQFCLNMGNYKLKYLDEDGDWILLKSEQDMSNCIKSSRKLDRTLVRLLVLQSTQPIPRPTGSYEIC